MPESTLRVERVYYDPPSPQPVDTWWTRYSAKLTELTTTARSALEADCRYILDRGIYGAGEAGDPRWPVDRVRTGLVMGSVQSGKTASMLGVSALAMDHGVDIVVVLAGTRISLWRQTYDRLAAQLDSGPDSATKRRRRLLCPAPAMVSSDNAHQITDVYRLMQATVRQRLNQRQPLIIVAMKQTDHLRALGDSLRQNVFGPLSELKRPAHMLVFDDEADDGSILDAVVEASQDPVLGNLKQIPRTIANLWNPATQAPSNLFTTYVAYTATPQANLLQEDHNPLAPRDFLVSLRTPLDVGHLVDIHNPGNLTAPRSSTYPEPSPSAHYTGGEVFYRRGHRARLCVPTTGDASTDLGDAVRAFLVAGAIRLHRSGKLGPATANSTTFDSEVDASTAVSGAHSMLFHPSATIADHFRAAEDVLMWSGIESRATARVLLDSGDGRLAAELASALDSEPGKWQVWLDRYQTSANEIGREFNIIERAHIPGWDEIKHLLANEIIPGTRVTVVNSDPNADDRPSYAPTFDEDSGQWRSARDLSTIFVSGNVMARGITLEGMTTALFQRSSTHPVTDTQMQMQRWFGYRGSYIELCRVFASSDQLDLFSTYHDIDEAIRSGIMEQMMGGAPAPAILQGLNFTATGKIASLGTQPLAPGAKPFVRLVNSGDRPDPNVNVIADLFRSAPSSALIAGQTERGRILDMPLSLTEAADLLDQFRYESYHPGTESHRALLWRQVTARANSFRTLEPAALYRPPAVGDGDAPHRACPYAIAAYFRLWDACLTRPINGLFVTGRPGERWAMADLQRKAQQQPRFWIGIRFDSKAEPISHGALAQLPFDILPTTKTVKDGKLTTTWGANDPTAGSHDYRGDAFFDYYHRTEPVPSNAGDSAWRPEGSDGQILFYVNRDHNQTHPAVAFGVCIPAGGPEQFSATRASISVT